MNEPFANADAANAAMEAFANEMREVRKKHRIKDVTIVFRVGVKYEGEGDEEGNATTYGHIGDTLACLPMLAEAYSKEQAKQRAILNILASGKSGT